MAVSMRMEDGGVPYGEHMDWRCLPLTHSLQHPSSSPSTHTHTHTHTHTYTEGVSLVLAGHPFDTIKVRMQTQGQGGAAGGSAPKFNGVLDCVKTTVANEGVQGLYKGLSTPLLMTGFVNSLLFGMQVRRP